MLYTIKVTQDHYGTKSAAHYGSFIDADSACDAAVRIEAFDSSLDLDVVPTTPGMTVYPLAAEWTKVGAELRAWNAKRN